MVSGFIKPLHIAVGAVSVAYALSAVDKKEVEILSKKVVHLQAQINKKNSISSRGGVNHGSSKVVPYDFRRVSYSGSIGGDDPVYFFDYRSGDIEFSFTSLDLVQYGYSVVSGGGCGVSVVRDGAVTPIGCHSLSSVPKQPLVDGAQQLSQGAASALTDILPF